MTKPTKRARKKDLTGVNLAAIKKRMSKVEERLERLERVAFTFTISPRALKASKMEPEEAIKYLRRKKEEG